MTKIGEPIVLLHGKKRGWGATLHGRTPFRLDGDAEVAPGGGGRGLRGPDEHPPAGMTGPNSKESAPSSSSLLASEEDVRSVLERYRSLAAAHRTQAKRRRLESARRSVRDARRLEQLAALHRMARETMSLVALAMRGEEDIAREEERERREAEAEAARAEREGELAEEFLGRIGGGGGGRSIRDAFDAREEIMKDAGDVGDEGGSGRDGKIGGIPSRFLDLSHFPQLQKWAKKQKRDDLRQRAFSPFFDEDGEDEKEDGKRRPIIDCTEEGTSPARRRSAFADDDDEGPPCGRPMRIPSFGVPPQDEEEEALATVPAAAISAATRGKRGTRRVYVSRASLPHVNGTYVQEGRYNDAPLFVRAGPPRKFMGKWDCGVVLRREEVPQRAAEGTSDGENRDGKKEEPQTRYQWKIGLVPARRVAHDRIIGYFIADEDASLGRRVVGPAPVKVPNFDCMEEDDKEEEDDGEGEPYFEPPAEGWRVFQENASDSAGIGKNTLGRASSLRVSYEE